MNKIESMPAATDRGSSWSNIVITTPTEEYIRIMLIIYPIQPNPSAFVTNHGELLTGLFGH